MNRLSHNADLKQTIDEQAHGLSGGPRDYNWMLDQIGARSIVLLGEASHGTHEFYRERIRITQRLITEKGFNAVAVEADWPDAYRVNRFVRGVGEDADATDALAGFKRFPTWMWRNADVLDFVGWLRDYNERSSSRKIGFYGLDLYSMNASITAVLAYLDQVDSAAARRARDRYACFDHFREDGQDYGYRTASGLSESCEREAIEQLTELQKRTAEHIAHGVGAGDDELFYAEQNARLVKNAEVYYRSMFGGYISSWNLRDRHMVESLDALRAHLSRRGPTKIVVWEHNSHVGDARATQMGDEGELNVGQLVRETHGNSALLVGFTTHEGTVTAASDWDAPAERKRVQPSLEGSFEWLLHGADQRRFGLDLTKAKLIDLLRSRRLERAIGVVYRPATERTSHYFAASLSEQFDAVVHVDSTRAVEPLERFAESSDSEPPETFPHAV
jgi:erythromycin esterase-like protein